MNARFMLDTDVVSFVLRGVGRAAERIVAHLPSELCISAVAAAQLRYGASRINSAKIHRDIDAFTRTVAVVPFDEACAIEYGRIASELAARGVPIGELDAMIAAHAKTLNLTLVTNNLKHFSRVRGLKVESWL